MYISDGYLILDKMYRKPKKITGTKLPSLVGINSYTKPGDTLLDIFNIYKPTIDTYWLYRGDLAEAIVKERLISKGYSVKTWQKEDIKYDNFPTNPYFGGLIDIAIVSPEREVVEVKSKNIKRLEHIQSYGVPEEELQGEFYAALAKCDKYRLEWVFFDDLQEQELKEHQDHHEPATITGQPFIFEKQCVCD